MPQAPGTRKNTSFPNITKVSITINGSPNMLYNKGMESKDMWTLQKFYTENRFGLLIDLRSMVDQTMHGSGTWLVNTTDGVQLEIERKTTGSGDVNCHIFLIADTQIISMGRQHKSVEH